MKRTLIVILLMHLFLSCKKDELEVVPLEGDTPYINTVTAGVAINTSVVGSVVDNNNQPIASAKVSIGSQTMLTNAAGFFIFKDISVDANNVFVQVSKEGYIDGYHTTIPHENCFTKVEIMILPKVINFTLPNSGGRIEHNQFEFIIPSEAFMLADGQPYKGDVNFCVGERNMADSDFGKSVIGGFQAVSKKLNHEYLVPSQILGIQVFSSNGELLKIQPSKTIMVTYADSSSNLNNQKIWSFNNAAGAWVEQDSLVRSNNLWMGTITHLNHLALASSKPIVKIHGQIEDCFQVPVSGMRVKTGVTAKLNCFSNTAGTFYAWVPAGTYLNEGIMVSDQEWGGTIAITKAIGPLSGEIGSTGNVTMGCYSGFEGNLVDCNLNPVSLGIVHFEWDKGNSFVCSQTNGNFNSIVPQNKPVKIIAFGGENEFSFPSFTNTAGIGFTTNLSEVFVCGKNIGNGFSILWGGTNGGNTDIPHDPTTDKATINYANSETIINVGNSNNYISFTVNGVTEGDYVISDLSNFKIGFNGTQLDFPSYVDFKVKIGFFGSKGELVEGHFEGTMIENGITYTIKFGRFSAIRSN